MSSVNKVILIGKLGKDPDIRTMNNGDRVAGLSVATSESWKDKSTGEKKEKTEWHRISIFNEHLVKVCENYLAKGSTVYLEGQLQTRKWTDQQGVEKFSTEIILQRFNGVLTILGGKPERGEQPRDDDYSSGFSTKPSGPKESYGLNDDIPF